ncbi:aminopeptidase P [Scopulibacillus darangshiensis]|uniref:Xaa-Pro aminopeptidase n=1 Tax=Scopulibacillus darangshiensis TaxID=442528 RepID=A0A4R2NVM7_9BACL|nr:aminopeptidase P family protein [Scopulibacillus darangshiensis]TCP26007.1 aminopeptidase P [Scopulibacillus darangshiensis]
MKAAFYQNNRKKLHEKLKDQSLTVMFAGAAPQKSADEDYPFIPNRNFYYLTGIAEPKIILVMTKLNNKVEEHLFIEKADPFMEKWIGKTIAKDEAKEASGIESIKELDHFKPFLQQQLFLNQLEHLYLDLERRSWESPQTAASMFAEEAASKYPYLQCHDLYQDICELRLFKTPEEVETIKKAARITSEGIKHLIANAKPGMKEYELEAYFNFILKSRGVKDFAFNTICASGKNATVLHYVDNNDTANDGELVLLDLGAQYDYYSSDISYTFPLNGKFSDRQKLFYNIVLKALREVTALIKPGRNFSELNEATKKILAEECQQIGLIENPEEISKYYYHGVSHSLGLDTHDVGSYRNRVLEPGMVLTVEPGLYIEEEAIGIRIEDDVLVTEDGYEVLTDDLVRSVEDIEAFMAGKTEEVK